MNDAYSIEFTRLAKDSWWPRIGFCPVGSIHRYRIATWANPVRIQSFSPGLSAPAGYPGAQKTKIDATLKRVVSIPHVTVVKFNFIATQQFSKLVLERNPPMVISLSCDVVSDHGYL